MQPYGELTDRLCEVPGISRITAWTFIAEIGTDMTRSGQFVRAAPVAIGKGQGIDS